MVAEEALKEVVAVEEAMKENSQMEVVQLPSTSAEAVEEVATMGAAEAANLAMPPVVMTASLNPAILAVVVTANPTPPLPASPQLSSKVVAEVVTSEEETTTNNGSTLDPQPTTPQISSLPPTD